MYVPFKDIADSSRVWVFQANRSFTQTELSLIENNLLEFTKSWTSHNHELETSYTLVDDKFIVLAVNEAVNDASGCSIDKSVNLIKQLEISLGMSLLEKSLVWIKNNESALMIKLADLKNAIANDVIKPQTIVYNTLVANKKEFDQVFVTEAENTWLKRYFKKTLN